MTLPCLSRENLRCRVDRKSLGSAAGAKEVVLNSLRLSLGSNEALRLKDQSTFSTPLEQIGDAARNQHAGNHTDDAEDRCDPFRAHTVEARASDSSASSTSTRTTSRTG
jgi:hypothetical protein